MRCYKTAYSHHEGLITFFRFGFGRGGYVFLQVAGEVVGKVRCNSYLLGGLHTSPVDLRGEGIQ